jgi:hypothetical protein
MVAHLREDYLWSWNCVAVYADAGPRSGVDEAATDQFGWNLLFARELWDGAGQTAEKEDPTMRRMLLIVPLMLTSTYCFAQGAQHMGTPQEQKACSRDASRFCRQLLGDDMAVQQCLQQHRAKLSQKCQKVFQSHGV